MSAICGIIRTDGAPVDHDELQVMVESSPNRGPDGCEVHLDGNVGFAHLAFHATAESVNEKQPFLSRDGQLILLADARLDNRVDLARKLQISPSELEKLDDAQLIMKSFQTWGEHCPEYLLGDFVFAVWSRKTRSLYLARDPLGARALVWCQVGQSFVFASEITAILDLPQVRVQISEDAVLKTLAALPKSMDETFFKDVYHLEPASCMTIKDGRKRNWKYWDIDPDHQVRYRDEAEYTDHFLDLMNQAVACRLRSIGPVGLSLSGGYDSTLLAAIAAKQLGMGNPTRTLKSFSYVFDHFTECDERRYIEPVVSRYLIDATYINADKLWTFSNLSEKAIHRDYLWTNCYSQLPEAIAGSAQSAGCRVLLDGMFGDALFCEPSLFAADLIRQGRLATLFSLKRRFPEQIRWNRDMVQRGLRPLFPRRLRSAWRRISPVGRAGFAPGLSGHWRRQLENLTETTSENSVLENLSPARRIRYRRIFQPTWSQGFATTRARPYNQAGLERLSPYFDRRLVEFIMAIPAEQVSHSGQPRKLQQQAMRRLLPRQTYERSSESKTGFLPLLRRGLLREESAKVRELCREGLMLKQGWVNQDWLEKQLKNPEQVEQDGYYLSTCLHLELWLRNIQQPLNGFEKWSAQ